MIVLGGSPLLHKLVVTPHGHFGDPRPTRGGIHEGVDFQAVVGDVVVSATAGTVARTGFDPSVADGGGGGGQFVIVRTQAPAPEVPAAESGPLEPYEVGYMHLSRIDVEPGQSVRVGEQLGAAGATGTLDNAPHLHLQIKYLGDPSAVARHINPEKLELPIGAPSAGGLTNLVAPVAFGLIVDFFIKRVRRRS